MLTFNTILLSNCGKGLFFLKRKALLILFVSVIAISLIFSGFATTINASLNENKQEDIDADDAPRKAKWTQDYIKEVPPIIMRDPFLELLGQTKSPIPYNYEEAVKLSGHSCAAVAGAWTITRKALEALYPNGEIPERGNIKIIAPGAEDEWYVGVFGEVMTFITGAAPKTGYPGGEFGADYNRRNLMIYPDEFSNTPPNQMVWVFERIDTGAKVGVRYDTSKVVPPATPERNAMGGKVARGEATPEEVADWIKYWNDRAIFVLENADTAQGLFTVTVME